MAGRRPAGARYPHAAIEPDHRFCPVLETIRQDIRGGRRRWGELVELGDVDDLAAAREAERGLYRARLHTGRRCGDEPLSVRVTKTARPDGRWSLAVQVWTREAAQRHIAARVEAGDPLAYNVMRK